MAKKTTATKPKRDVHPYSLSHIELYPRQKELINIIENNDITFIKGPAGCLTKNQKINIYIMKGKKQKRTIIYEKNNTDSN